MKKLTLFLALLTAFNLLFADIISDKKHNFSLDIPEGFDIKDANENNYSYHFSHPNIPVQFILKVEHQTGQSAKTILESNLKKLNATFETASVNWESEIPDSVGSFEMKLDQAYKGWGVSAQLESDDGWNFITVLAWAPAPQFDACQQFIIALLNSLTKNDQTCGKPGIFMAYAFPKEGTKKLSLDIGGYKIQTSIDKSDEEANQYLIDLEFSVLTLYANHPLWKEAWQRYYRLVFRDTYGRMETVSEDINKALFPVCRKERPEAPDTAYLTRLLSWVQRFEYQRDQKKNSSDLTPPLKALTGSGNDCDSRSLLLSSIMQHGGYDSILLISKEYSHAMCAVDVQGQGQRFDTDYGSYLMCETTAKVTPGIISVNHQDRSKWIVVD